MACHSNIPPMRLRNSLGNSSPGFGRMILRALVAVSALARVGGADPLPEFLAAQPERLLVRSQERGILGLDAAAHEPHAAGEPRDAISGGGVGVMGTSRQVALLGNLIHDVDPRSPPLGWRKGIYYEADGISLCTDTSFIRVEGNEIRNTGEGIDFQGDDIEVVDNLVEDCQHVAVKFCHGAHRAVVRGNHLRACALACLTGSGGSDVEIRDNWFCDVGEGFAEGSRDGEEESAPTAVIGDRAETSAGIRVVHNAYCSNERMVFKVHVQAGAGGWVDDEHREASAAPAWTRRADY